MGLHWTNVLLCILCFSWWLEQRARGQFLDILRFSWDRLRDERWFPGINPAPKGSGRDAEARWEGKGGDRRPAEAFASPRRMMDMDEHE